jgi:hypothetical protein
VIPPAGAVECAPNLTQLVHPYSEEFEIISSPPFFDFIIYTTDLIPFPYPQMRINWYGMKKYNENIEVK